MALISFPRNLPDELPIVGLSFPPSPMIEVTPLRSGRLISKDLGPTLWRARWQSARMMPDEAGIVRAFYDTVLSLNEFYGYDRLRDYPLAYRTGFSGLMLGGNPFTGACTLADVAANGVEMSLGALPPGFVLSPGDYLAFDYGTDSRALHRASVTAVADAGGRMTIEVRPHVRPGWAADAVVQLHRPAARMKILPDTYSEAEEAPHFVTVSFEAIQTL